MSAKDVYVARMETQLNEWTKRLAAMKVKLDEVELQSRLAFHKQVEASQQHHEDACMHLDELKQSGEDAWEALKLGVEAAWKELAASTKSERT
ncbi:MAG: hypothetical protein ACJ79H_17800 [Myxococcales bacterium]